MLFKQRILLANCDTTEYRTDEQAKNIFRRQLHTGLLCGNGVVLNVGAIVDIPDAVEALNAEHDAFIENCAGLLAASTTNDNPLIVVRGLPETAIGPTGRMSLVQYFESRDKGWIISSLGGMTKGELQQDSEKLDKFVGRMEALSDRLNELGARAERVSPAAANRLREHVKLTVETLKTQNRSKIVVSESDYESPPEITFDDIADIAATVASRSQAYGLIDRLARERVDEKAGMKPDEDRQSRAATALVARVRAEFIDPAYKSIFLNPGETLVDGSFDFADEKIIKGVGSLRRLHLAKEDFLASLKHSHPRVHALLQEIPSRLRYMRFIALLFQPHLHASLLLNSVTENLQSEGKRLVARAAWTGFQFYYRQLAAAQEFNDAWDGRQPSASDGLHEREEHKIIDDAVEDLEAIDDIKETLDGFSHILDDPNRTVARYA